MIYKTITPFLPHKLTNNIFSFPDHSQISSCSRGETPNFSHSCEIKSGSGLGTRHKHGANLVTTPHILGSYVQRLVVYIFGILLLSVLRCPHTNLSPFYPPYIMHVRLLSCMYHSLPPLPQSPASPRCKITGQEPGNEASYNQPYFDIPSFPGSSERELYTH